jgi:hypothetical protein
MKRVLYSPELDVVVISHGRAFDFEQQHWVLPVEWNWSDMHKAMAARPKYKGCADLFDWVEIYKGCADLAGLFDWVEIGEFE